MRKYWAIFKISWQNAVEYRMEFIGHMLLGLISLLVMYYVWLAVFKVKTNIGNYTFSSLMTYYLVSKFVHFAKRGNIGRRIARGIKDGDLSIYLVRPVSYPRWCFASFLADRVFEVILRVMMLLVFIFFFPKIFVLPDFKSLIILVIFLNFSLIVNFLFNFGMAVFAFFMTDIRLFQTSLMLTTDFLDGDVLPLDLLPGILKIVSLVLPFQFMVFFPIKLYQGGLDNFQIIRGFSLCLFWIVFSFLMIRSLWQKGLKNYESIGR